MATMHRQDRAGLPSLMGYPVFSKPASVTGAVKFSCPWSLLSAPPQEIFISLAWGVVCGSWGFKVLPYGSEVLQAADLLLKSDLQEISSA